MKKLALILSLLIPFCAFGNSYDPGPATAETDPVWTAASNTAVYLDAQYPNAVLRDGSRAMTLPLNFGTYWPTNMSRIWSSDALALRLDTGEFLLVDYNLNLGGKIATNGTYYGSGVGLTSLNGANITASTIGSNALDSATDAAYRAGGSGGGSGATYSEDFTPADFDASTNLTITHNLGYQMITQIRDKDGKQHLIGNKMLTNSVIYYMDTKPSMTGTVIVASDTNYVNFSAFLTSGNVDSNDLNTATDTAYRSGGGASDPANAMPAERYIARGSAGAYLNNLVGGETTVDWADADDPWNLINTTSETWTLQYGNTYDGRVNVWKFSFFWRDDNIDVSPTTIYYHVRVKTSGVAWVEPQTEVSYDYGETLAGGFDAYGMLHVTIGATNGATFTVARYVNNTVTTDQIDCGGILEWVGYEPTDTNAYPTTYF